METYPSRPTHVPEGALWDPEKEEWGFGMRGEIGPVGSWTWWRADGTTICGVTYNTNGELHGLVERWHPNGERAQWGEWHEGRVHGMLVKTRPSAGASDALSAFPAHVNPQIVRMDIPYVNGVPIGHEANYYLEAGRDNPVPCDSNGVSVELGKHLGRVARGTLLRRVTASFTDIFGEVISRPGAHADGPWLFHGANDANWVVVQNHFRDWDEYLVSSDEMSRAFALSADLLLARES